MLRRRSAVAVFILSCSLQMFAQGGATGAISGTVQDTSGAVLAGARIEVTNEATGQLVRAVTADSSGLFSVLLLPVGTYTLQVTAGGLGTVKFEGISVRITETTRMTAVLKPAAVKEVVEVTSEVARVNTSDATTGQSLGSVTITSMPLATRNFQQLLTLSAGASSDLNNASQLGRGQVYIHVNGGREDNNNYLIEGISASDYAFGELTYTPLPSPDAIQEFKVSTSLYDATQGRNGGGNINASLKTGTSKFHGSAFEYFRNTKLDANDYFLNGAGLPRPVIQQNIFGGDFGGPLGPKAQLGYFYVNYQGTRQRSGDSPGTFINTAIPVLPLQRDPTTLYDDFISCANCPATGATAIDTVASSLLEVPGTLFGPGAGGGWLFPSVAGTPGFTTTTNGPVLNYGPLIVSSAGKFTDNQFTESWDREFRSGKDHISERFFWSDSDTYEPFGADSFQIQVGLPSTPNNLNFPLEVPLHSRFGSITETHIFGNNLVNEFRFGINIISDKLNNQAPVTGTQLGINLPTATGPEGDDNMYRLQFGSWAFGPYPTQLQSALSDNFVWLDTVSWTHGKHQFRFGGEADRVALRRNLPVADNGLVFFAGPQAPTDFQGFLEGSPFFGEAGGGASNHDYRIPAYSWFAQDDYRVTKSLTLNLGVRNEFLGAPYDEFCHIGNTDPSLVSVSVQPFATPTQPFVYPTCVNKFNLPGLTGTKGHSALDNNWATVFEPRIGFAYAIGGHHTTSIRGGYGIYSVREDLGAVDNLSFSAPIFPIGINFLPGPYGTATGGLANLFQPSANFPTGIPALGPVTAANNSSFVPTPAVFTGFAPLGSGGCELAFGAIPPAQAIQQCGPSFTGNVNSLIELAVPLHWVSPTTQQWNLTIQRELGGEWFAELGYVGTKGSRLRSTYDPNQATLATQQSPVTIPYGCTGGAGNCTIVDSTAENASARAPYLGIAPANFEEFAPNSDSHYSALQASLAHHFAKGLYFQGAYTYSKSIDDVSTASVAFDTRFNDQNDPRASRGLSDFDRRQRFIASAVYQLPFFSSASGLEKAALGGWEVSGVITVQSGTPFTVVDPAGGSAYALSSPNLATATFTSGSSCANAPSSGSTTSRLGNWVNASAYQQNATLPLSTGGFSDATVYGDSPRNCIIGPHQNNVDITFGKTFKITEGQNLRFRTDFFNLFNHPSFANPSAAVVGPAGGSAPITSVIGTPRLIQFSLKYSF
jgi:Carboxypeptidase regulatory-like domain